MGMGDAVFQGTLASRALPLVGLGPYIHCATSHEVDWFAAKGNRNDSGNDTCTSSLGPDVRCTMVGTRGRAGDTFRDVGLSRSICPECNLIN